MSYKNKFKPLVISVSDFSSAADSLYIIDVIL